MQLVLPHCAKKKKKSCIGGERGYCSVRQKKRKQLQFGFLCHLSTDVVLVCWDCRNKYHKLGGLNDKVNCLTVLKASSL